MKEGYFENLQLVAECATAANLPFWVFIQACAFQPHVRVPNAAEIFWQVNTALAYGAKGVQYFTFVQPADSEFETFRGGMIDRKGNVTEIYEAVREIDRHVLACGEYLLHANPVSVAHGEFLESKFVGGSGTFKYIVNVSLTQKKELHLPACRAIVRGERVEGSRFILAPGEGVLIETEVDL